MISNRSKDQFRQKSITHGSVSINQLHQSINLFRSGDISQFEGDLTDQDSILDFLTNLGATEEVGKVKLVIRNNPIIVFDLSKSLLEMKK